MLDIQYYIKSVYGNDLMYPKSDDAKRIARIYGRETINEQMIEYFIDWIGGTSTEVLPERN